VTASGLLEFHFMVNAFRAGTMVAVLAGAMGWFMVLRRQAFAGHSLAVVSFPGAAAATWLGVSATLGSYAAAVVAAIVIGLARGSSGAGAGAGAGAGGGDSAVIGTVQAFLLACGGLFIGLYGGFLTGLNGLLFGSFLGIADRQVATLAIVGVVIVAVLGLIGRPLFFASVDGDVAEAAGVPVQLLSVVFLVLLGCAAAAVSQITGALLVFALLVLPAASAQRLTSRPALSFGLTIAIAVAICWAALAVGYYSVYPIGFLLTTFGLVAFVLASAANVWLARHRRPIRVPQLASFAGQ
jgi:zinc/manganese transport system permease protein